MNLAKQTAHQHHGLSLFWILWNSMFFRKNDLRSQRTQMASDLENLDVPWNFQGILCFFWCESPSSFGRYLKMIFKQMQVA